MKSIVEDLEKMGFSLGLLWKRENQEFVILDQESANLSPPLIYVIVDKKGQSVKTGRALKQTIRQRLGPTKKGLNERSTRGQNTKPIVVGLRREVLDNGPLRTYVRQIKDEPTAKDAEKELFDLFPGRLDRRRG